MMELVYIINLYLLLLFFLFFCIIKIYYYYQHKEESKIVIATEVSYLTDVIIVNSIYNNN